MEINIPQIVSEVTEAFYAYESALIANDVPALENFFWDSPQAARFGATEQLYGYDAICEFRRNRVINFSQRKGRRLEVTTFGEEFSSIMYEYTATINGEARRGRQSQTWAKQGQTWKIVSAHISQYADTSDAPSNAQNNLSALGLAPDPSWLARIEENFRTTSTLAGALMNFPLPPHTEPAPVFTA